MAEAAKYLHPAPDKPGGGLKSVKTRLSPDSARPQQSVEKRHVVKHWRVDLKWVFGIPFTLILASTLVVFSLFQVSGRDNAMEALTAMNRVVVSEPGMMDELNQGNPRLASLLNDPDFSAKVYEDPSVLERALGKEPGSGEASPENLPSSVSPETAGSPNSGRENSGQANNGMGAVGVPIKMITGPFHSTIGLLLTIQVVLLLLTGIPYLALSRRAGRLVSAGISLALASWLPFLILWAASGAVTRWVDNKLSAPGAGEQEQLDRMLTGLAEPWTDNFFGSAFSVYRFFAFTAVMLLVLATVFFAFLKMRNKKLAPGGVRA